MEGGGAWRAPTTIVGKRSHFHWEVGGQVGCDQHLVFSIFPLWFNCICLDADSRGKPVIVAAERWLLAEPGRVEPIGVGFIGGTTDRRNGGPGQRERAGLPAIDVVSVGARRVQHDLPGVVDCRRGLRVGAVVSDARRGFGDRVVGEGVRQRQVRGGRCGEMIASPRSYPRQCRAWPS